MVIKKENQKSQLSLDFLAGMTVFLLTVVFVFNFVSSVIVPFTTDTISSSMSVSDRAADKLYSDLLTTEEKDEGILDNTSTRSYFQNNDADDMKNDLGLMKKNNLNVTITSLSDDIIDITGTDLNEGDPVPSGDVPVAEEVRVVSLEGDQTAYLKVRVW